jgi:YHS domain-containing protein
MDSESPTLRQNSGQVTNYQSPIIKSACGGTLQDPSAYPSAMFNGERVYFCNAACLQAFLTAPEAFMAGEVEHPLEDDSSIDSKGSL